MTQRQTFGQIVRERRQELKLSQQAVAERLGVTQPTVARWEADQSFPKPPELSPLAAALKLPLEELLAPLEDMAREPVKTSREQMEEITERLSQLEINMKKILKLLGSKGN